MAEKEYIEREAAYKIATKVVHAITNGEYHAGVFAYDIMDWIDSLPAADVPPALWADDPIVGTEFMTHNQGNRGFEIHFRTDSREKYEAVQTECRRQIDHAKPAADVREVKRGKWLDHQQGRWIYAKCSECETVHDVRSHFCPNCGAEMEGEADGT